MDGYAWGSLDMLESITEERESKILWEMLTEGRTDEWVHFRRDGFMHEDSTEDWNDAWGHYRIQGVIHEEGIMEGRTNAWGYYWWEGVIHDEGIMEGKSVAWLKEVIHVIHTGREDLHVMALMKQLCKGSWVIQEWAIHEESIMEVRTDAQWHYRSSYARESHFEREDRC